MSWYPGLKDRQNLSGTRRTLDGFDGDKIEVRQENGSKVWIKPAMPDGLISRSGWAVVDDSAGIPLEAKGHAKPWVSPRPERERQDLYFLGYGHDYRAALQDAAEVFGRQPLLPRYALGYWYSRYFAYMDRDIENVVEQFERYDVPLDVMVIDMDWHLPGWTGTTWCRDYFPNHRAHLQWLKKRGIKIGLNLHPADGVGQHEEAFAAMKKFLGKQRFRSSKSNTASPDYLKNSTSNYTLIRKKISIIFPSISLTRHICRPILNCCTVPWKKRVSIFGGWIGNRVNRPPFPV